MTPPRFSALLLDARAAKGMSQTDLAKAVGIAPAQISRYEQGKNMPRPHIIQKIDGALGTNLYKVLADNMSPNWSKDQEPPNPTATHRIDGGVTMSIEVDDEMAADLERGANQLGISVEDFFKGVVLEGLAHKMEERKMPRADIEAIAREVKALLEKEKK